MPVSSVRNQTSSPFPLPAPYNVLLGPGLSVTIGDSVANVIAALGGDDRIRYILSVHEEPSTVTPDIVLGSDTPLASATAAGAMSAADKRAVSAAAVFGINGQASAPTTTKVDILGTAGYAPGAAAGVRAFVARAVVALLCILDDVARKLVLTGTAAGTNDGVFTIASVTNKTTMVATEAPGGNETFGGGVVATLYDVARAITHNAADAVVAATKTWHFVNAAFTAADVGKFLLVQGASHAGDVGAFTIASVLSATNVTTTEAPSDNETFGAGVKQWVATVHRVITHNAADAVVAATKTFSFANGGFSGALGKTGGFEIVGSFKIAADGTVSQESSTTSLHAKKDATFDTGTVPDFDITLTNTTLDVKGTNGVDGETNKWAASLIVTPLAA